MKCIDDTPKMDRYELYRDTLDGLKSESRFRCIPPQRDCKDILDLCSNDYMGLSRIDTDLKKDFRSRFADVQFSASASRLLSLNQNIHNQLEEKLENLYGQPALLFNSGYHANTGIVSALNVGNTLFVADKLVHASMIDGLVMGRCQFKRFPHNDISALKKILEKESTHRDRIVIMVESIYSMDGDKAPLREIVELRALYDNALLYVDEAHAFGVRGKKGLGLCEELNILPDIDILIGTLGKAAYSAGAFCIAPKPLKDLFVNCARSFIFSTALPPANMAWSIVTIDKLLRSNDEREYLKRIAREVHMRLEHKDNDTPIVPYHIGDASKAIEVSRMLAASGILALPIRRPTVPAGTERIRFSLNAALTSIDIVRLFNAIDSISHD